MLEDALVWLKRKGNQTPRKSLNSEVRCASSDKKMVRQITGSLKILRHSSRPEVNHWSKSRSMRDIFLFKVLKSKKVKKNRNRISKIFIKWKFKPDHKILFKTVHWIDKWNERLPSQYCSHLHSSDIEFIRTC